MDSTGNVTVDNRSSGHEHDTSGDRLDDGGGSYVLPDPPVEEPELVDVNLMRCLDAECSRFRWSGLDDKEKLPPMVLSTWSGEVRVTDILTRSDGRPLVMAEWFTQHLIGEGWDSQTVVYSCADVTCSSVTSPGGDGRSQPLVERPAA